MAKKPQNFYWEILSPKRAIETFKEGKNELYKLFSDDTESLIESEHDLHDAIDLKIDIAIERLIH